MSWQKLHSTYQKHGVFFAIGAGVSLGSSLPNWLELLRRLSDKLLADQVGFDELKTSGLSLPAIAAILKDACSRQSDFPEHVREALYRDFQFYPDGVGKHNHAQFVRHVRTNNPTLRSVASLCARESGPRVYEVNPRIHAVVTFNLDALLQAYVYARFRKRLVRTIERPSASRRPDKINVYHMHGFLRFDRKWNDPQKGAPDKLVLTEQEYFDYFNAPTSLFNYTFLHLLREYSCIFIGLSMQDDNIRRLLHYSQQERLNALLEEGKTRTVAELTTQRHFAMLKRTGSRKLDQVITSSLQALGTHTLWVRDFHEIPARLQTMYESVGLKWKSVF